jgi:hypothetical protein
MIKRKQIVIKKENQIWYKNKLKSNVKGWIWKQNSIRKRIKKITIKRMKTKFDIKLNEIKWLEMDLKKKIIYKI